MRYLHWSGDDGMFGGGFTLGLFPPITMREEGPVLITSNPALMMTKMPRDHAARATCRRTTSARIADYDKKLGVIAERYLDHDVRAVTGTTCWFTLLFEKVLAEAREARPARPHACARSGRTCACSSAAASRRRPTCPSSATSMGRDDVTLVDTYNATEGGVYASTRLQRRAAGC